jgi:hypothetical protein
MAAPGASDGNSKSLVDVTGAIKNRTLLAEARERTTCKTRAAPSALLRHLRFELQSCAGSWLYAWWNNCCSNSQFQKLPVCELA